MQYFELDDYEKEITKDYEQGKLKSVPNAKQELAKYKTYAKAALGKTKNVNIRLSESDLLKIKAIAEQKGLPYQTLVASVIHQYSKGKFQ